jgi:hypothetical protein
MTNDKTQVNIMMKYTTPQTLRQIFSIHQTKDILMMKHTTTFTQRQRFSTISLLVAMLLMIAAPPPLVITFIKRGSIVWKKVSTWLCSREMITRDKKGGLSFIHFGLRQSLAVLLICGLGLGVPVSAATYDFSSLSPGNLNGQDGWVTTKWNTATDVQVNATHGYDGSQALQSTVGGGGVGGDGSRQSGGNLTLPAFTGPDVQVFDFDVINNWWGTSVLIGYDTNSDGKITRDDTNEWGVGLHLKSESSGIFKLWTGSWKNGPSAPTGWSKVRIVMDTAADSNQGRGCVLYKNPPDAASWQLATGLQGINLNLDTSATDARNPNNWDQVFFHFETDGTGLDNLTFSTVSKPTDITLSNSSVAENSAIDTVVGAFDTTTTSSYTYSLVAGTGDTDNGSFTIDGNNLKTNAVFDYETKNSYSIRVRADSVDYGTCISFEKVFTIAITNVNEIPVAGFGTALDFDGTNDYASIPSGINIANQSFTF